MVKRILFVDCFSGASGDMWLGALVDLGVPIETLEDAVKALKLPTWSLSADTVLRKGIAGTKVTVRVADSDSEELVEPLHAHGTDDHHHGVSYTRIREIVGSASLSEPVREASLHTFRLLAEAEAEVHGVTPEEVHFHEVGAADALIDVVATCAGVHSLRVDQVVVAPIPTGRGMVQCAHGLMPIPVPATEALLRGWSTYGTSIEGELVTPTGAALLRSLGTTNGPRPTMSVEATGYGAGARDFPNHANMLRLQLGTSSDAGTHMTILETQIDDMNPEWLPPLRDGLLEAGARDVWVTPISMKKGRQGCLLSILALPEDSALLRALLFRESTTFGVREYPVVRTERESYFRTIDSPLGPCRVRCSDHGGIPLIVPEYEDCLVLAQHHTLPLRVVYDTVRTAAMHSGTPNHTGEEQ